jgi:carnitine 3-dehydrogenase
MGKGSIRRVAVIGAGVIGASWAAHFLAHGLEVVAYDPDDDVPMRLQAEIDRAWPALERLGLAAGARKDAWRFVASLEEAAGSADFVQENGPEREAVKRETFRRLDAAAPAHAILASSSSGFPPSTIQADCVRPGRVLVGHPFNPPHLIPLVEVVGGARTDADAIERAMAFYAAIGKRPIHVQKELVGHVVNRLQAALWREAFHLVQIGAVTVGEIDGAIAHGPGLRWALLGPCLLQHLSGGPGGIAHVLEHLGPLMEAMWDDLGRPRLDAGLKQRLVDGVDAVLASRDETGMLAERDAILVDLLRAKANATHLP